MRKYSYFYGQYPRKIQTSGALWAYVSTDRPTLIPAFLTNLSTISLLAIPLFFALLLLPGDHLLVVLFQRFLISILALLAISRASIGLEGRLGQLMDNKILQYAGHISYGLYVFHMLVPGYGIEFMVSIAHRFGLSITLNYWSHRMLSLILLVILASLSWYLFEKPFNSIKRYLPYKQISQ